jgi:glycosyltransferase involved in cell wall biosynthesis
MSSSTPNLSLVIPCYNESKRINLLTDGLRKFCQSWNDTFEVIIVDDGSKDNTLELLKSDPFLNTENRITVLPMPKNGGKGAALKFGINQAKGNYILTLDADMSSSPSELINWLKINPQLFKQEVVHIGSRVHPNSKIDALTHRKWIGGVFNGFVKALTPLQLNDTQCGFKLYPAQKAKEFFNSLDVLGWAHDVEVLYRFHNANIPVIEMPLTWKNEDDSKVNVLTDSIKMFFEILKISIKMKFQQLFIAPFEKGSSLEQKLSNWSRLIFVLLAFTILFLMPKWSFDFSVTGDEHWHHDYGKAIYAYFFEGDKSILDYKHVEGSKKFEESGIHYYGGLFDLTVSIANHKLGLWGDYEMGHFINAIVGAIGIVFCGLVAMELGGWFAGLLALLLLFLSPSYLGHCFNNPKDIPFASASIMATYYLIRFFKQLKSPSITNTILLSIAIGAALGVRIGGLLFIVYLWFFAATYWILNKENRSLFNTKLILRMIAISIGGYLIGIACWPYALQNPIGNPLETLGVMSHFFTPISLLFGGETIMNNEVPASYIPTYIGITAPLVVVFGLFLILPYLLKTFKQEAFYKFIVIFVCFFPWAYATYKGSALYDGWRHFLFIYPPLVVLTAVSWKWLFDTLKGNIKWAVPAIVAVLCLLPIKFMAKNHGFESLYFNEWYGGINEAYTNYETDYWMNSSKQAFDWVIQNEKIVQRIGQNDTIGIRTNCVDPMRYYVKHQFGEDKHIGAGYVRYTNRMNMNDWDYGIFYSRFMSKEELETPGIYPPKSAYHVIKVDDVPVMVIIKRDHKKEKQLMAAAEKAMARQKIDSAMQLCNQVLAIYSENPKAVAMKSQLLIQQKQYDLAINLLNEALLCNQQNIEYYYFIGMAYLNKGDKANAKRYIGAVAQANPNNAQLQELYQSIQ